MSQLARIGEALDEVERLHGLRLRGAFDIDLEEVMQEDKVKVGSSLVKCCGGSKEELAKLLSGFLMDYGQRHTISVQDILADFALSTISNDFGTWLCDQDNLLVANWQDTISMVLQFMKEHPDKYLEVSIAALQSAPVPWSPIIQEICDQGLGVASVRKLEDVAQKLKEQSNLAKLKTVLAKFSCKSFNVSGREAERVIQRVIKRGATYTEALEISTLLPTPVTRARTTVFFIEHSFQKSDSSPKDSRDDDRIYQCLETLKADEILEVAERVLARCFSDIQVSDV